MNQTPLSTSSEPGTVRPILRAECIFALALLLAFPLFAVWGRSEIGDRGLMAAWLALGICWSAGAASIVVTGLGRTPETVVSSVLGGMLIRMGLPLFALMVLPQFLARKLGAEDLGTGEFESSFGRLLVVYYLFALIVDVALVLKVLRIPGGISRVNSPKVV